MDEVEPRVAGSTTLRNQAAFTELGLALRRHRDEFAAQMHAEMLAGIDGLPHDEAEAEDDSGHHSALGDSDDDDDGTADSEDADDDMLAQLCDGMREGIDRLREHRQLHGLARLLAEAAAVAPR